MRNWTRTLALAGMVAGGAAGCQDGVGTRAAVDEETLRADVALVAADAMFEDLSMMQDPAVLALAGAGPGLATTQGGGSHSFTKVVTFLDAAGGVQDRYDPLLTASISVVWDFTREASQTFWSASVTRHRDLTITGLEGEETERVWNGTGTGVVAKSRHPEGGSTRTYDMTSTVAISDVVKGVPRAENPYPKSGTITRHITAVLKEDGEIVETRDLEAVITFDGSQFATVTVGPDSWQVDLAQGGLKGIFRRKQG